MDRKNASREFLEYEFVDLLTAVKEIEQIYEYVSALDIEFAILEDGTVVIFQVRPLAAKIEDYCTDDRPGIQGHKGACKVQVS